MRNEGKPDSIMENISKRESAALINSLTAGVVPRIGLRHIAVGRKKEVDAFLRDLSNVEEGGAAFRLICGKYGSGKSFLLQMIRNNAMERNFVVMDADLSPERRLTGSAGQGLATYAELMQHLATQTRPEGGALESILQRWIVSVQQKEARKNNLGPNDPALVDLVSEQIEQTLMELCEMKYGFAFSTVLQQYWIGMKTKDDVRKQNAIRWLRGEYSRKSDARKELGVDSIIDDGSWYDFLKLFAMFVSKAGYKGLLIFLDEGVNLYKIQQRRARDNNYEKMLTIFNDTMQGKAQYIGVFFSGTEQLIYDERRGLFSYEALKSRLQESRFQKQGYADFTGPIIRLETLSPEELYLLLERLAQIHAQHFGYGNQMDTQKISAFLNSALQRIGAQEHLTPREITRDYLGLLNILQQNPDADFASLIQENAQHSSPAPADETDFSQFFSDFTL